MARGYDSRSAHERIDRSCDLLGSAYRRYVVYSLQKDGPASVAELADALVASQVADERERAMASLVHTHLPKLDEFGVIDYEGPEESVSLEQVGRLEPFLTAAARREADAGALPQTAASGSDAVAGNGLD